MDSLRADIVFAFRRLRKSGITSAAAILSLALAIGACTSAFRLIDALLLRPLPIAHADRLYELSRTTSSKPLDSFEYAHFEQLRSAAANQATLLAISFAEQVNVTYGSDAELENAHVQYVSGSMFDAFGLTPAAGRLLAQGDDRLPVAVLSHDYWNRRFAKDPNIVGRTFRLGDNLYEIAGVVNGEFKGTEPGTVIDIFLPERMHWGIGHPWSVFRVFAMLGPGVEARPVREKLSSAFHAMKPGQNLFMDSAGVGASSFQTNYRLSLEAIGVLVALVLLIACANVANLMAAQSAARSREMALRVSLGAGRGRLIQLVLVESALIAFAAAAIGALLAWWGAPYAAGMISTLDHPVSLSMPADWRVFGFAVLVTMGATFLFGLAPALRASDVTPAIALKDGDHPHSRRRWMRSSIGLQTAFCFLVLFVAGLFVTTFERLSNQPTGISPDRILAVYAISRKNQPQATWDQIADHLRHVAGVEKVAMAEWPILDGWGYRTNPVTVDGARQTDVGAWYLFVSPGMFDVMKMPLIAGRDFTETDLSAAVVNSTFVKTFFNGENPIGRWFEGGPTANRRERFQIVGVVRDARYRFLREEFLPVAYLPFQRLGRDSKEPGHAAGTFIVRTSGANPLAMAPLLHIEISRVRPEFLVSKVRTEQQLIDWQTVRERLLAMLAAFFGLVALVLAGVGLYGVLNYAVIERRKEIGIRMAIGARASDVARLVTADIFAMVLIGAAAGLGLGMASARYLETLFFEVKATEAGMLMFPGAVLAVAATLAAMPAVIHAVRIDPVETLRAE